MMHIFVQVLPFIFYEFEVYHSTKKWQHSFDILKSLFLSNTHQSMKMLDSDLRLTKIYIQMQLNVIGCF